MTSLNTDIQGVLNRIHQDVAKASEIANQAHQQATNAINSMASHERLCEQRYRTIETNIASSQQTLSTMHDKLDIIQLAAARITGIWATIIGVSVLVGIFVSVVKVIKDIQ